MRQPSPRRLSLLNSFRKLDLATRNILADIDSPLQLGLVTLTLAEDHAKLEYLSLEHIMAALEAAGVAVKRKQLARAMARAGNRVGRKEIEGEPHYKVMTRGRREAERLLTVGSLDLIYVERDRPRTARHRLEEILRHLSGTVRICDPYSGVRTLEALEMLPPNCVVRFLTATTSESTARLRGPFRDFKRERPRTQLRLYPHAGDLHDRYVLARDRILIIGHGLKDIGERESFVIAIRRALVPDLLAQVVVAFDDKWTRATPI